MNTSITLNDAAERLGVHYMTAYKYVRTGRLTAIKEGGQWRVATEDLEAFEAGPATGKRAEVLPSLVEERLLAGDENGSFQLLENAMASGAGGDEIYLDLIAPAMTSIGERWHRGDVSISDEHLASATALRLIARLGPRLASRGRMRGSIVLATVAEDFHYLPTAMIRDLLRFRGYDVQDLGANTPPESILERALAVDDLLAIGLSATNPSSDDVMKVTISTLREGLDVPIVVGGGAFSSTEHIAGLGECMASGSAREALEIFDQIYADARSR